MCKRIFKIQALIKQLLTKYQIFMILPQISYFHKYRNFSSIFCNFLDQLLHPYKFHGRDMSGILFFIFASCHPLIDSHLFHLNEIHISATSNLRTELTPYFCTLCQIHIFDTINPRLAKLFFVTRLTRGVVASPSLDFPNRTPYEIGFGINR